MLKTHCGLLYANLLIGLIIEEGVTSRGVSWDDVGLAEMDAIWEEAKEKDR